MIGLRRSADRPDGSNRLFCLSYLILVSCGIICGVVYGTVAVRFTLGTDAMGVVIGNFTFVWLFAVFDWCCSGLCMITP